MSHSSRSTPEDPNVLTATLCEGAQGFSERELNHLLARLGTFEDPTQRAAHLRGAGCVRDSTLVYT